MTESEIEYNKDMEQSKQERPNTALESPRDDDIINYNSLKSDNKSCNH